MMAVIDYGIGNVRSVLNALAFIGHEAALSRDPQVLEDASALILPGVGAFGEGMRRIRQYELEPAIDRAMRAGKPILGICLGFQLLMRSSDEMGHHSGLGLLPFEVQRLPVKARLPHIGWTPVSTPSQGARSRLMDGVEGESFYFVHSHGVTDTNPQTPAAYATYGGQSIMGVIESGNILGTQFHPEKSGPAGLRLLTNFANFAVT